MKDKLGMISFKDVIHPPVVPDGSDEHQKVQIRMLFDQLVLNIIGIVFIDIQNDQLFRMMEGQLTADLASDGAAPAGDQDHLALDIIHDLLHLQLHRIPAQQILDLHLPEHGHADLLIDQLVNAGKHQDLAACLLADIQKPLLCRGREGRNGDDDLLHLIFFRVIGNLLLPADHGNALEICTDLDRIIVYDTGDRPVQMLAVFHLPDDHIPGRARSHDHGAQRLRFPALQKIMAHDPDKAVGKTVHDRQRRQDQQIQERIAPGNPQIQDPHPRRLGQSGRQHRADHVFHLHYAGKPPQTAVKPEKPEQKQGRDHIDVKIFPDRLQKHRLDLGKAEIKPDPQGPRHADQDHQNIQEHQRDPPEKQLPVFYNVLSAKLHFISPVKR